jgi:16S rRNA processing protein RimM
MSGQERSKRIPIAKLGRSYGVKGWQKIYLLTDFPQQFKPGAKFPSDRIELEIEKVDLNRGLVKFKGVNSPEEAKKLTNRFLYSTEEESRKNLQLGEGEYFWFDILGKEVWSRGKLLGKVKEIDRLNGIDYLFIETTDQWRKAGYPKRLVLEFSRHIERVDLEKGQLESQMGLELLESLK